MRLRKNRHAPVTHAAAARIAQAVATSGGISDKEAEGGAPRPSTGDCELEGETDAERKDDGSRKVRLGVAVSMPL